MTAPRPLFRAVAVAEGATWALLLVGMFLKYVTETTELAVSVFGLLHGVVFIAYCLTAVVVAVDQRWSLGRAALSLVAAVPPFATVVFERYADRRGAISATWRLTSEPPARAMDRPVGWLLRHPLRGAVTGLVAIGALTGLALVVGPPA